MSWSREDLEEHPERVLFNSDVAATRSPAAHLVLIMVALGSLLALTAASMAVVGGFRVSMLGVVAVLGIVMLAHPLIWRTLFRGERRDTFDEELAPARPGDDATV